jgi:hypothetical protein
MQLEAVQARLARRRHVALERQQRVKHLLDGNDAVALVKERDKRRRQPRDNSVLVSKR